MIQGSLEWHAARLGLLTASRIAQVVYGGPRQWAALMDTLDAEKAAGPEAALARSGGAATDWGHRMEPEALAQYELTHDVDVEAVGFLLHHEEEFSYVGASPDGLLPDRVLEVKCPYNSAQHAYTVLMGMPPEHCPQVQCQLWVTGKPRADFISYDPRYPDPAKRLLVFTVERDEGWIAQMAQRCREFWAIYSAGARPGVDSSTIPQLF